VLVYFGAIDEVLAAVHARLQPGGWLVFTLEELLPDRSGALPGNGDWALHRQGRYAHSVAYVTAAALQAGFAVHSLEREVLRFEADSPVAGILVVLERTRHDG